MTALDYDLWRLTPRRQAGVRAVIGTFVLIALDNDFLLVNDSVVCINYLQDVCAFGSLLISLNDNFFLVDYGIACINYTENICASIDIVRTVVDVFHV